MAGRLRAAALAATVALTTAACTSGGSTRDRAAPTTSPRAGGVAAAADTPAVDDPVPDGPRGGVVRVAVWAEPDPGAPTLGGAAVRSLVLPQLFYPKPDGRWGPSLVEPGSDASAPDLRSATFRLRRGAAWSDGSPVTAADLRRSADARFVASVEGPAADGLVTVSFTQPLPGWRRLWSAADAVAPPAAGVWGGPFLVSAYRPGLEVVLRPNPGWAGPGPFLDEVRLVLVPDPATARALLARGEIDVVSPPAETRRTVRFEASVGIGVSSTVADGGWWVGLLQQPQRLDAGERRALTVSVDRSRFVSVLLESEAVVLDGFGGPLDHTWSGAGWAGERSRRDLEGLDGKTVDLVAELEEPMSALLHRAMQKRVQTVGGRLELRAAEAGRVEPWLAEGAYDAAIALLYDPPGGCWQCRWGGVDLDLARAADAGDLNAVSALEAKLASENLALPLWRPRAVVAWRESVVRDLRANPFGLSGAWDAWR